MPSFESPLPYSPTQPFWPQSFYFLRVDGLPVHPTSAADLAAAAANNPATKFKFSGFNQSAWNADNQAGYFKDFLPAGTDTSPTSPARRVWFTVNTTATQPGRHLWFPDLRQQNASRVFGQYTIAPTFSRADKHAILWSESSRELVEAIGYRGDRPDCEHLVSWDLDDYEMGRAANGTTPVGATATRFPVSPLQPNWQDFLDAGTEGDLGHMLGFSLLSLRSGFRWPARFGDGKASTGLISGSVLRLRASFPVNSLPTAQERVLARTLQRYGMVLFDTGGFPNITAVNDPRWPSGFGDDLFDFADFDVVDTSSVQIPPFTRRYPLEPPPGTIRIGCTQTSGSVNTKHEVPTGQPLGMHRRFISSWAERGNMVTEIRTAAAANRAIHVSTKTPNWAAVANGNHDAEIITLMQQLRDTNVCAWVTFWHEPENDVNQPDTGTAANWRAMQIKFDTIRAQVGADNILVVPVLIDDTIANGAGPDWVIENTTRFPVYGVDLYSQNFSTSPLDLRANPRYNANMDYLLPRGFDVAFPEVGGTIGTTTVRNPNFYNALINEALDPANRIKAICWFDDGNNQLGGPTSDPSGGMLAAFHASLVAPYSYRGGARRGTPKGQIDFMRVTTTTPNVTPPPTGTQTIRRRVAGNWLPQILRRRIGGQWVTQTARRTGS